MNIFVCQDPEHFISQQQALLLAGTAQEATFALQFCFDQYYLAKPHTIELIALIHLQTTAAGTAICAAILAFDSATKAAVECLAGGASDLQLFANQRQIPWIELSAPLILEPIKIAKPWGQEIWYTGIEERGQSNVVAQGFVTPLPWVLALMPRYLTDGHHKKIILLKTLDPLRDEIYGDLYFELHEQKQEVYVVTHLDPQAWPNKVGEIRLGFATDKLSQFASEDEFKAAYLAAVADYEAIRRRIDDLLDVALGNNGLAPNVPAVKASLSALMSKLPQELQQQEQQARAHMNSFSALVPLRVGDVVKIPCFVPHALQHGVRTIELQTPVYERKILSFAQKVLTQSHWDTQAAMANVQLTAPQQKKLNILSREKDVLIEEVVKFEDFRVIRINLAAGQEHLIKPQNSYALLLPIGGNCSVVGEGGTLDISAETAVFVPQQLLSRTQGSLRLRSGNTPVQVLMADVLV